MARGSQLDSFSSGFVDVDCASSGRVLGLSGLEGFMSRRGQKIARDADGGDEDAEGGRAVFYRGGTPFSIGSIEKSGDPSHYFFWGGLVGTRRAPGKRSRGCQGRFH